VCQEFWSRRSEVFVFIPIEGGDRYGYIPLAVVRYAEPLSDIVRGRN